MRSVREVGPEVAPAWWCRNLPITYSLKVVKREEEFCVHAEKTYTLCRKGPTAVTDGISVSDQTPERVGAVIVSSEQRVVTATIDRAEKRNAIDFDVIEGLNAAIRIATEREASVLVLRGSGGHFSAGADLHVIQSTLEDGQGLRRYLERLSEVCNGLERGPFVAVAVVSGYALAGGCELLLACDLAVADYDARIGDRHLENSLLPGGGGSVRLFRALTSARARWLLYTAEMISGRQAEEWGLVSIASPSDHVETTVNDLIARIVAKSPAGLRAMKKMTLASTDKSMIDALAEERKIFLDYATGSEHVQAALTSFLEPGRRHRETLSPGRESHSSRW